GVCHNDPSTHVLNKRGPAPSMRCEVAPMKPLLSALLSVSLLAPASAFAQTTAAPPAEPAEAAQTAQPLSQPPAEQPPPPPSAQALPPPQPQAQPEQPMQAQAAPDPSTGQWVYTAQYGW